MNLIEIDKIFEFMDNGAETIFTEFNKKCDSYWEEKETDYPLVSEYMFDTPVDMMDLLKIYIGNEKLQRQVTADAFKRHSEKLTVRVANDKVNMEEVELPEYVYVF